MRRAICAFVFLVILTVVGLVAMERAPPTYRAGVHSLVGVMGLVSVSWALVGGRKA